MLDQIISAAHLGWAILAALAAALFWGGVKLGNINTTLEGFKTTMGEMKDQCAKRLPSCTGSMIAMRDTLETKMHDEAQETRRAISVMHGRIDHVDRRVARFEGPAFKTPHPESES